MGFRQKVALALVAVIIYQITITNCMPSTSRKSSLKRYLDSLKQTKSCPIPKSLSDIKGIKKTKSIFTKGKNADLSYNAPKKSMYKAYNFPEIEYPHDTYPRDPFYKGTNLNTFPLSKNRAPCSQSNSISDMKKDMRMKRKLNRNTNIENGYFENQMPSVLTFSPGTESIWMQNADTFPEVHYPVNAMETWAPHYWNPSLFTQNEQKCDWLEVPEPKELENSMARYKPYKKELKSKTKLYLEQVEIIKEKMRSSRSHSDTTKGKKEPSIIEDNTGDSKNGVLTNPDINANNSTVSETIPVKPIQEDIFDANDNCGLETLSNNTKSMVSDIFEKPLETTVPMPYNVQNNEMCPAYDLNNTKIEESIKSDTLNTTNLKPVMPDIANNIETCKATSQENQENFNANSDWTSPLNIKIPLPTANTDRSELANIPIGGIKQLMSYDRKSYTPVIVFPVDDSTNNIQLPCVETNSDSPFIVFIPAPRKTEACTQMLPGNSQLPTGETASNALFSNVSYNSAYIEPISRQAARSPLQVTTPETNFTAVDTPLPCLEELPINSMCHSGTDTTQETIEAISNSPSNVSLKELTPTTFVPINPVNDSQKVSTPIMSSTVNASHDTLQEMTPSMSSSINPSDDSLKELAPIISSTVNPSDDRDKKLTPTTSLPVVSPNDSLEKLIPTTSLPINPVNDSQEVSTPIVSLSINPSDDSHKELVPIISSTVNPSDDRDQKLTPTTSLPINPDNDSVKELPSTSSTVNPSGVSSQESTPTTSSSNNPSDDSLKQLAPIMSSAVNPTDGTHQKLTPTISLPINTDNDSLKELTITSSTVTPSGVSNQESTRTTSLSNNPSDDTVKGLSPTPNIDSTIATEANEFSSLLISNSKPSENPLPDIFKDGLLITPLASQMTKVVPNTPLIPKEMTSPVAENAFTNPTHTGIDPVPDEIPKSMVPATQSNEYSLPVNNLLPDNTITLVDFTEGIIPPNNIDIRQITETAIGKDSQVIAVLDNLPIEFSEDGYLISGGVIPLDTSVESIGKKETMLPLEKNQVTNEVINGIVSLNNKNDLSLPDYKESDEDIRSLSNNISSAVETLTDLPHNETSIHKTNEDELSSEEDFLMLDTPISNIMQVTSYLPTQAEPPSLPTNNEDLVEVLSAEMIHPAQNDMILSTNDEDDGLLYLTEHIHTIPEEIELNDDFNTKVAIKGESVTEMPLLKVTDNEKLTVIDNYAPNSHFTDVSEDEKPLKIAVREPDELKSEISNDERELPVHNIISDNSTVTSDQNNMLVEDKSQSDIPATDDNVDYKYSSLDKVDINNSSFVARKLDSDEIPLPVSDITQSNIDTSEDTLSVPVNKAASEGDLSDSANDQDIPHTLDTNIQDGTPLAIEIEEPQKRQNDGTEILQLDEELLNPLILDTKTLMKDDKSENDTFNVEILKDKIPMIEDKVTESKLSGDEVTSKDITSKIDDEITKDLSSAELIDMIKYLYSAV